MRFARIAVCMLALAALWSAPVKADGVVDPQIIIRSGGGGTISITSATTPISINPATEPTNNCVVANINNLPGFTCIFENLTGTTLSGLTFSFGGSQGPLFGFSDIFGTINVSNDLHIHFTGGGIAPGQEFLIDFLGFTDTTTFTITPVPEPGTLALVGSGLAAIVVRRKRRKQ